MYIKLSKIKISPEFLNSIPNEGKYERCKENWLRYNRQDRYVVINSKNELIDGYVMYLVLQSLNVKDVQIKRSEVINLEWRRINNSNKNSYRNKLTTYVYACFPNKTKEYIWRIPAKYKEREFYIGEKIIVKIKNNIQILAISKILWSSSCPVNKNVKKAIPTDCATCANNIEYPPPHTCDVCTSLDEKGYPMWKYNKKGDIDLGMALK